MRTVIIEIFKDAGQLKMGTFYKNESMAHRQYSIRKISEQNLEELCADTFNVFSRTDRRGRVTTNSLEELRKSAHLLYDQALTKEVKAEIRRTDATHLIFYIDEQLVHIPWELLHDGNTFLCLRFATGRVVLTSRKIQADTSRDIRPKLKMLAVCDPAGNLKKAYEEGMVVRNELDRAKDKISVDLRTTDVDVKYTLKNIREYDVFHFAGHAKYNREDPSKSGLIMKDGDFSADKISTLGGSSTMPLLVFANACSSGETEGWRIEPAEQNKIYGLANTFLLAGVKYYMGTFWKVEDGLSMRLSRTFYRNIRKGKSIGEALRLARVRSIEKFGKTALIWASYMLYGDPADYLIKVEGKTIGKQLIKPRNLIVLGIIVLISTILLAHNFLKVKEEKPLMALNIRPLDNVFYVKQNGTVKKGDKMNVLSRNIARGKEMYASSAESKYYDARYASDHNLGTRWSSEFSDPQWIYVDLGKVTPIGHVQLVWQAAAARSYEIEVSNNAKIWKTVWRTNLGGGLNNAIDLSGRNIFARYVRVYCKERVTEWGYSLYEFEVYPDLLPNIAIGKKTFASSNPEGYGSERAVDGNMGTRWGSEYSDPQWLYVDLGRRYSINMVTIQWEFAYGSLYKIQRSDDGKNWIDACEIKNNKGNVNNIYFESPIVARYVRLYGLERGTEYGYSVWEFEVLGLPFSPR